MQPSVVARASSSSTAVTTPLRRLAVASTTTCAKEASDYGKCVVATYTDVHKDTCKAEFERFGACLRQTVRQKKPLRYFTNEISLQNMLVQLKRKW